MLNIGPQELLVILVIALLVVGPQRLPELGRSIGRWMRELRNAQDEVKRTIRVGLDEPNGDASTRPTAGSGPPRADSPGPTAGRQSPTPTVGSTPDADETRAISRSLGRSLGEIRRAREEVQRSFRVDLDAPRNGPGARSKAPDNPRPRPDRQGPPQGDAREPGPTDAGSGDPAG